MHFLTRKKILLLIMLSFFSGSIVHAKGIYRLFDKLGGITDWFLTRGKLSEKHEAMFDELVKKFNLEDREIKARNTGLLLRLLLGYQAAEAVQLCNRVYLNEDCLREMSDEPIKFIMAHELTYHDRNYDFKQMWLSLMIDMIIEDLCSSKGIDRLLGDHYATNYFTSGIFLPKLSIWGLLEGQISQYCETEADAEAIIMVGINPEDGAKAIEYLFCKNTKNWPLYARIRAIFFKINVWIESLPILKQHALHLASFDDRVAHLRSLQPTIA